jgi:hypothetical protein
VKLGNLEKKRKKNPEHIICHLCVHDRNYIKFGVRHKTFIYIITN